nr:unnamed protein product [Digitaria exilis]
MATSATTTKKKSACVVGAGISDVGGQWLYDPRADAAGDPLGVTAPVKVHSSMYASVRLIGPRECMGFSDFQFVPRPGRDARRFPARREMYCYLKDFCAAFRLAGAVRLNTKVVHVAMASSPEARAGDVKWKVRSVRVELDGGEEVDVEEVFDAVVVFNGHYSQPRLPSIKGMEVWRRRQLHSHSYRVPDPFRGEIAPNTQPTTLETMEDESPEESCLHPRLKGCLVGDCDAAEENKPAGGGGDGDSSGQRRVPSICNLAGQLRRRRMREKDGSDGDRSMPMRHGGGHRKWRRLGLPDLFPAGASRRKASDMPQAEPSQRHVTATGGVEASIQPRRHLHPPVDRLCSDGTVAFADDVVVAADTVIYCTGYTYSIPFLDTAGLVTVDVDHVGPLYEHTFPPSLAPSLSFVGVPMGVFAPWFFEAQARWIALVLTGKAALPPETEMMTAVEEGRRAMEIAGAPAKHTHFIPAGVKPREVWEFVYRHSDLPRMEDWKVELFTTSNLKNAMEDREAYRDRDDDSESVREGGRRWRRVAGAQYEAALAAAGRGGDHAHAHHDDAGVAAVRNMQPLLPAPCQFSTLNGATPQKI